MWVDDGLKSTEQAYTNYDRIFTSFTKIGQCGYTVRVTLRQSFERKPMGTGAIWKNGRFMSDWDLAVAPYVKPACSAVRRKLSDTLSFPLQTEGEFISSGPRQQLADTSTKNETSRRLTLCSYQYSVSSTDVSKNASIYGIWYFKQRRLTIWRNAAFENFLNWRLVSLFCFRLWTTHKMPWCACSYNSACLEIVEVDW